MSCLFNNKKYHELNRFLIEILPSYMVPSEIHQIEKIPINHNGKVDKKNLDKHIVKHYTKDYVKPKTHLQKIFCRIWSDVLNKKIGITDNFFTSGGDSIKNMLLVSKCAKEKINLQVQHIFHYQTIEQITENVLLNPEKGLNYVNKDDNLIVKKELESFILTPSQKWLLDINHSKIKTSGIDMLFSIKKSLPNNTWKKIITNLINFHDVMKLKLIPDKSDDYSNMYTELTKLPLSFVNLKENNEELINTIEPLRDSALMNLDPILGKVVYFTKISFTNSKLDFLLITMHHIICDGISWRIIMDDLNSLIEKTDDINILGIKSTSYQNWAKNLNKLKSEYLSQNITSYWHQINKKIQTEKHIFTKDTDNSKNEYIVNFSTQDSKNILNYTKKELNGNLNLLFIAAFCLSYYKWCNINSLSMLVYDHGRESEIKNINLSRTVGLFTTNYPIFIDNFEACFSDLMTKVNDIFEKLPKKITYNMLKYRDKDSYTMFDTPHISFNYMGEFNSQTDKASLIQRIENIETRNLSSEILHKGLNIIGMNYDDQISFILYSSLKLKKNYKLEELQNIFKKTLIEIIK